jgi:hypothetical protein
MRITRIDFEGQTGRYATAQRRRASGSELADVIEVTILCPEMPDGRKHYVTVDCEHDLFSMAECLQHHLDGPRGSNSMIHEYYAELLRLSDL